MFPDVESDTVGAVPTLSFRRGAGVENELPAPAPPVKDGCVELAAEAAEVLD